MKIKGLKYKLKRDKDMESTIGACPKCAFWGEDMCPVAVCGDNDHYLKQKKPKYELIFDPGSSDPCSICDIEEYSDKCVKLCDKGRCDGGYLKRRK